MSTSGISKSAVSSLTQYSSAASQTASSSSASSKSSTSSVDSSLGALTGGDFMTLLITQLKNQDPMDPQDPTQMMSQLSTLTSVQKLASIDQNITKMLGANTMPASSYLGNYVGLSADSTTVSNGDGGTMKLNLPQDATSVTVNLLSADGQTIVDTMKLGAATKGDAFASLNFSKAPDGDYKVSVTAASASGQNFNPAFSIGGIVTSVRTGVTPTLMIGGREVQTSTVIEVATPPNVAAA